jgi:uncharacterized repeat protein (TIGR03803 family)
MHESKNLGKLICGIGSRAADTMLATAMVFALTVVLIQVAQSQLYVMYSFTGGQDGQGPVGLTIDRGDTFYGTTYRLFKFSSQDGLTQLNSQGYTGSLWFGPDRLLYGTDISQDGAVFKLSPPANALSTTLGNWTETVLYTFSGSDGQSPNGPLVYDQAGNLYGTTAYGGAYGGGTVFELTPSLGSWTESVLYSQLRRVLESSRGVIFDKNGDLYGTTFGGGAYGDGTVFQLTPSENGWTKTILHSFHSASDGAGPWSNLVFDRAGNLYGTAYEGGRNGAGTIFELTPSGGDWAFTVIHDFDYGFYPSSLTIDAAGNLYGTAVAVLYKLAPSGGSWTFTLLHSFTGDGDGGQPTGSLQFDSQGNLWGTTGDGGIGSCFSGGGCGVIYKYQLQ